MIFFFLLVRHLHREGKREGWPLELDGSGDTLVEGVGGMPMPKTMNWPMVRAAAHCRDLRQRAMN